MGPTVTYGDAIMGGRPSGPVANVIFGGRTHNGAGGGNRATAVQNLDLRRPFLDDWGRPCVHVHNGKWTVEKGQRRGVKQDVPVRDLNLAHNINVPVWNSTTLRKEEWVLLDQVVLRAARYELCAYADLAAANTFGGFNGMGKMVLEHETMSDTGEAIQDMHGITPGRNDAPKFQLQGLPLPITHMDFQIPSRLLAVSQNTGTPIDVNLGEAGGRRVAEMIEAVTIGTRTGVIYGGASTQAGGYGRTSQVYGYLNFPDRLTKTNLTVPTGANPEQTVNDVLNMRTSLYNRKYKGPYYIYHSNDWDPFMDNDYARAVVGATSIATVLTLRQRLKTIAGVLDVRRLDMLFATAPTTDQSSATYYGPGGDVDVALKPYTLIMVQMTDGVARAVSGLSLTTVQWEEAGGMNLLFKTMAIEVAQLRSDQYSNCGIMVATTS